MERANERPESLYATRDLREYDERREDHRVILAYYRQKERADAMERARIEGLVHGLTAAQTEVHTRGFREGVAVGVARGARQARLAMVGRMCAALGISFGPTRETFLRSLDDVALECWIDELLTTRRCPGS